MTPRAAEMQAFLDRAGWGDAAVATLAGDASNRRYFRLARETGARAVLMDAPPDKGEDTRPFIALSLWLAEHGFSAPHLLASDPDRGFLLLEDLGDDLFARVAARQPDQEGELYAAAVDLLAELAGVPAPSTVDWPGGGHRLQPYDLAVLLREAMLAPDWYLAGATGGAPSSGLAADFAGLVGEAMAPVAEARDVVVLRDYHAENLLWLPERRGSARVGLLDYQDALAGHPAYDLVSLLEDARRDTSPELQEAMIARYLASRPDLDAETFRSAYAILGAQRNLKIVGIFARLCLRDGKPGYVALIPRVWGHLRRDLQHPALAALAQWVGKHLPEPEPAVLERLAAAAGSGTVGMPA